MSYIRAAQRDDLPIWGVGLVGLSASGGWGAAAHVPAMAAAGGFALRGLVASSRETAQAASRRFGIPSFDDVEGLASAEGVDLVVITVRTPRHRELVLRAATAGKPIFCEWPFAVGHAEARDLAAAARGLHTFVGLHGRSTPQFRWLGDLVAQGYVGDVLSATVLSRVSEWGSPVTENAAYTLDASSGATMLEIGFGHAIDPVLTVLGELTEVVATTATRHTSVPVAGSSRRIPMTSFDQIAISGVLEGGAVLSAHQRGAPGPPGYRLSIEGTDGILEASAANHPHIAPLTLRGSRGGVPPERLRLPASYDAFPRLANTHLHSLTHAYAGIRAQLDGGPQVVPDFTAAVRRHRLLDLIAESSRTGRRLTL